MATGKGSGNENQREIDLKVAAISYVIQLMVEQASVSELHKLRALEQKLIEQVSKSPQQLIQAYDVQAAEGHLIETAGRL